MKLLIEDKQYINALRIKAESQLLNNYIKGRWADIGFGAIKPPTAINVENGTAILINNKAFYHPRPLTFDDFIICHFIDGPGNWVKEQHLLQPNQQSSIARYIKHTLLLMSGKKPPIEFADEVESDYQKLIRLSFEFYILTNLDRLPKIKDLRSKLKKTGQNSDGARNEIRLAVLFLEAGYDIEWKRNEGTKVEFDVIDTISSERFAVESKRLNEFKIDTFISRVNNHINNALDKKPLYPYFIFIDANLPPEEFEDIMLRHYCKISMPEYKTINGMSVYIVFTNIENNYLLNWKSKLPPYIVPDSHVLLNDSKTFQFFSNFTGRITLYPRVAHLNTLIHELT